MAAIGVGWVVYSRERRYAGLDAPVGGTVLEVIRDTVTHQDTGEIDERRLYRCLCTYWPSRPFQTIDSREVDLEQLYGLDRGACWAGVRWLVRQISQKRRGQLTSDELDCLRYAFRLAAAAT